MHIQEFIGVRTFIYAKIARDLGYSKSHIQRVFTGKVVPCEKLAHLLEEYTEGAVTVEQLMRGPDKPVGNGRKCSITAIAKDLKYTIPYMQAVLTGKKIPSLKLAKRIEKYTNGEVTVNDLLNPNKQRSTPDNAC